MDGRVGGEGNIRLFRSTSNESAEEDEEVVFPLPGFSRAVTHPIPSVVDCRGRNTCTNQDSPLIQTHLRRHASLPTRAAMSRNQLLMGGDSSEEVILPSASLPSTPLLLQPPPPLEEVEKTFDLIDAKEVAAELSRATSEPRTDPSSVSQLIAICQSSLGQLNDKITSFNGTDFGELLSVHSLVTEAINDGKNWTRNRENYRRREEQLNFINERGDDNRSVVSINSARFSLQSDTLRDIYGLLCHLRGRMEQTRINAAQALLRLTRHGQTDEQRHLIIQSGGMQSFLTLFQSSSESPVLMTVSALNVANLIPSYTKPFLHKDMMVVIDCLLYLVQPAGLDVGTDVDDVTPAEVFKACVDAMTYMWMNCFEPNLSSSDSAMEQIGAYDGDCFTRQRFRITRRSFQDNDDVEYCHLVNAFISLAVTSAGLECNHMVGLDHSDVYGFANILQSICAIQRCQALAMNEGVMSILLKWLRSKDSKRQLIAANTLRDLIVSRHSYTAGWAHAELLNDGKAIAEILERLLQATDLELKRCIAEIVSCLSSVPHTRAAIVEAQGFKCLGLALANVETGYEDYGIAVAVGKSLLNLTTCSSVYFCCRRTRLHSNNGCILDGILQKEAMVALTSMSRLDNYRELRFLYSKLLRVISDAPCSVHPTQQLLCDIGAVKVLGRVLSSNSDLLRKYIEITMAKTNSSDLVDDDSLRNDFSHHREAFTSTDVEDAVKEMREVLRGLCNIFSTKNACDGNPLIKACSQLIRSGGVKSLLWVVSMTPDTFFVLDMFCVESRYVCDIRVDSCQALSSLCPILLSQGASALNWAPVVLSSLIRILKIETRATSSTPADVIQVIQTDALQGIVSLAECEALRTRIIDESMPLLLRLYEHENGHVSDAAKQACIALGFSAAELGASWDAYHLVDKFVFMRSLLIQSLVRDEIRKWLDETWTPPLGTRSPYGGNGSLSLFQNLCKDNETSDLRNQVRDQFINMNEATLKSNRTVSLGRAASSKRSHRTRSFIDTVDAKSDKFSSSRHSNDDMSFHTLRGFLDGDRQAASNELADNFLGSHQYPLNGYHEEKNWIVQHCHSLQTDPEFFHLSLDLPIRVNNLLRVYFPSALIREEVIPLHGLSPHASFDFRALCMPSQKYCSFRREGLLVSSQFEGFLLQSERVHCTLGFRNSSFALEFADSFLQTLYLCPAIQGLSFSNDLLDELTGRGAHYHEFEGSELLAYLVRMLPSSISYLTFDDVFSNSAALTLVHILQSMKENDLDDEDTVARSGGASGRKTSFVRALAVMNSPHIQTSTFISFIETINSPPRDGTVSLFQSLCILDLSGNLLGDDVSARVLQMVFLPSFSHNITRLDLSRNGIKEGRAVKRILQECASSKPKLKVLDMSMNDLGVGDVASDIVYSLADVLSNLTSLDLSSNILTGEVLDRLGGILAVNCYLQVLNISNNQFSKSSVESLTSMLCRGRNSSSRLCFLHLNGNSPALDSNQEMALCRVMNENRARCISAHFEDFSNAGKASIDDLSEEPLSSLSEISSPKFDHNLIRERRNMITVLFSAPLVWRDDQNNYYPIEMLDFELEKSLLWQCFTEASRNIDLSFENATTDRLQAARTKGCGCLHYSGHGHPTHLTFEDGSGGIHWLEVDQLKDLILAGGENDSPPFNFVFVSACHSFLAGQTFVDAGVPHVVCCQQEAQIMDNAALSFTRAFYLALAFGRTVKESFETGKQAVLNSPTVPNSDIEMKKFLLLPEEGNHEVAVLNAEPVPEWPLPKSTGAKSHGTSVSSGSSDSDFRLPSLPQGFLGRETDMYHVLNMVLSRRLVTISGPPGIGRSSLAAALCHYIDERKSTMMFEHIYFVRYKPKRNGTASPIFSLCDHIKSTRNWGKPISTNLDLDEAIEIILRALRKKKTLLAFERIDALERADAQDFQFFLSQIFAETKDVHVLISSDKSLGLLQLAGVGEGTYKLEPLSFRSTMKLFAFWCPHLQSSRDRKELLDLIAPETDILDEFRSCVDVSGKVKSMLGDGIPARILSAAHQMSIEEFNELKTLRLWEIKH